MVDYLKTLDPLGTVPAQSLDISIYDPSAGMYQIYLTGNLSSLIDTHVDMGGMAMGDLSPLSLINLDEHTKEIANIPSDACYTAWSYPIVGVNLLDEAQKTLINTKYPEVSFAMFGGFAYFDVNKHLVQVNAIFAGNNINFKNPKNILYNDIKKNYIDKGRLQDVTNQSLIEHDIVKFCWLGSDDMINNELIAPNGGFMYMYSNKYIQCFEIKNAESEQIINPIPDNNSPFSIIANYLKIIDTDYETELDGLSEKEIIIKLAEKCKTYKHNLNRIQETITCKMCSERPIQKAFTCGHMLCEPCINTVNSQCPYCRQSISNPSIKLFFC